MTPSKHSSSKPLIRAALYARISTLNHGQDPEVQLGELREFCKRRGFEIVDEYVDTASAVHASGDLRWISCLQIVGSDW